MKARTLAREIEKHRALSASLEHRKARVDEQIVIMEELLLKLREHEASTTIARERSMFGSKMELRNADAKSKRVKIAAAMTDQETPAKKALLGANLTPQDVADALKVGRSTVNAWCNGTRSIPRRYREWLKEKHRIPPGVWKNQAE